MIAGGVPLAVLSHQLGHARTCATTSIYARKIASAEEKLTQTFTDIIELKFRRDHQQK